MKRNSIAVQQVYVRLGRRIRELRKAEYLSSIELAAIVKVTPRVMQRIETGQNPCPVHVMLAVAEAFDTSFDELIPVTIDERNAAE